MNTDNNQETTITTPSHDTQDSPSNVLLLSTSMLIEQEQNLNNNEQQQSQKKKKSHGNRKEQHKRRRERRRCQQRTNNNNRNPTDQNIIRMAYDNNESNRDEDGQGEIQNRSQNIESNKRTSKNKRKRQDLNRDNTHVRRSISQLSISHGIPKKRKSNTIEETSTAAITAEGTNQSTNETINVVTNNDDHQQETNEQEDNDEGLPATSIKKFKPPYLKVSTRILKRMLSNAIQDANQIIQRLDTDEKIQAVRQMMELTNNLYYFELQRDLWQTYFNLGIKENIWTTVATNSNINQVKCSLTYFFPKQLIEQRQKTTAHQTQRTNNELQEYLINLQRNIEQWQPSIDFERLNQIVSECVKKAQQRLKQQFIYQAEIVELDLHDRQAMTKFYNLQPNPEQIDLTKKYWQIVANEQRTTEEIEKLRKRIYLKRIPSKTNKIIDQSIDHIQPMLQNSTLDKDQRAGLISNYSKTITQYKVDLMSLNLNTLENIRRGHQQTLITLEEKISPCCTDSLKQAIHYRSQTMKKRHEKFLEHTLKTFFDEAPTTIINNE